MAITYVNSVQFTDKAPAFPSTINLPAFNCSAHNLVVVGMAAVGGTTVISDTAGNTYVKATTFSISGRGDAEVWYCLNTIANASNVITITSPTGGYYGICAAQYTAGNTLGFVKDILATGMSGSANSISTSAFTTAIADEVIVAYATQASAGTLTAGSGYTKRINSTDGPDAIQDSIVSTIQTSVVSTMTSSQTFGFGIIAVSFYEVQGITVAPPALAVTATLNAPTLQLISSLDVAPPAMTVTATLNAPTLSIFGIWHDITKSVSSWTLTDEPSASVFDETPKSSSTWEELNKS